jgi:hypothetical protein
MLTFSKKITLPHSDIWSTGFFVRSLLYSPGLPASWEQWQADNEYIDNLSPEVVEAVYAIPDDQLLTNMFTNLRTIRSLGVTITLVGDSEETFPVLL